MMTFKNDPTDQFIAAEPSIAHALLVSSHENSIDLLTKCLDQLAIAAEVSFSRETAISLLARKKFEAVILDRCTTEITESFLDKVRSSPANRSAVTFMISDGEKSNLANEKPNFVLGTPLTQEAVNKTLNASFGLIVRERRRYFRCPTTVPIMLRSEELGHICCQIVDISEGGIALITPTRLRQGLVVDLRFELPGQVSLQDVKSVVCWHNAAGRAGLRFLSQTHSQKAELQTWLARRLESSFPERVLTKYRAFVELGSDPQSLRSRDSQRTVTA